MSIFPYVLVLMALVTNPVAGLAKTETKVHKVSPKTEYQDFKGFGTSLAWFGNAIGGFTEPNRTRLMDLLFDKDKGLGLNVLRYNIGGGDAPDCKHNKKSGETHMRDFGNMPGYSPKKGVWDWNADAGQRWVLQAAKQRLGNELVVEAFSNAPPYWMTKSLCNAGAKIKGKNNLHEDHFENFADYLTEVVKHFRDHWGIHFYSLEPMNEPKMDWGAGGLQEGNSFTIPSQEKLIKAVKAKMIKKGLGSVRLTAMDESSVDKAIKAYNGYDKEAQSYIQKLNTHGYWGTPAEQDQLREIARRDGHELWQSESDGSGNPNPFDPRPFDTESMVSVIELSTRIRTHLQHLRPTAWVFWQAIENYAQMIREDVNWGLIVANFEPEGTFGLAAEEWKIHKKFYAMAQYSKFIRKGATMIAMDGKQGVAFLDKKNNKLILVLTNENKNSMRSSFDLSDFKTTASTVKVYRTSPDETLKNLKDIKIKDNSFSMNLIPRSITTFVIAEAAL